MRPKVVGALALALLAVPPALAAPDVAAPQSSPADATVTHRLTHGRRSLVAGIFLSYAGAGLVASGAILTLDPGPGATRPTFGEAELGLAFTGASALMAAGGALQIGGSLGQLDGLARLGMRPHRGLRYTAIGVAGAATLGGITGAVLTANPAWRRGSGVVVFGTAGLSLLAATLHTVALIDADQAVRQRDPSLVLTLGPTRIAVRGRL